MNLTPEEKLVGQTNYYEAVGVSRRDFLKGVVAAGAVSGAGLGAMYFGYDKLTDPVRVGVIGTGDEGSVLIGALNPDYMQCVAIADIRPSSIHRAFHGDWASPAAIYARPGLMTKYGWKSESEARKHVKVYDRSNGGYEALLKDPEVEAVVIALPLHLHHPAAIAAMKAGKHVLTEKLMAHNIAQCKEMGRVARETDLYLAVGHQRHYSVLYDNAVNLLRWGLLGELHFIQAQWHRGNLPGGDSWQQPLPGGERALDGTVIDKIMKELESYRAQAKKLEAADRVATEEYDLLMRKIAQWEAWDRDKEVEAKKFGYEDCEIGGRSRTALEELIRWRLWNRTGGGLMAELGSHQLDAASIFVSALRKDGKKARPLTVHAIGGRQIFPYDRDADDHVYCMYEFPAPGYDADFDVGYRDPIANVPDPKQGIAPYEVDNNKKIVVTYSSIMGNGYGGYGEVVMGSKGTLVVEREQDVMLYKDWSTTSNISVKAGSAGPTMDTQASGPPTAAAGMAKAADAGPVSRGYTEELEHFAWCIRNKAPEIHPRCYPEVAAADAVIALTSKLAIERANKGKGGFVVFKKEWFDLDHDATPEEDLA